MNKEDLIWKTSVHLKQNGKRKELPSQRATFRITDDLGNASDFVVKKPSKPVEYTMADITNIFESIVSVIENTLAEGEEIVIRGFGTFTIKQRKETATVHPVTNERIVIKPHYVPKFSCGNGLKMAAKKYELSFTDSGREVGE